MFRDEPEVTRKLRAMWSLWVTGGLDEHWLIEQLRHPEPHVRVWALRLLADSTAVPASAAGPLAALAADETNGLVLSYLASALQKLPAAGRWGVARGIAARGEFAKDPGLTRMVWYGIEPVVPKAVPQAVELATVSKLPDLPRFIARRLTEEIAREPSGVDELTRILPSAAESCQVEMLTGMTEALDGWRKAPRPQGWPEVAAQLSNRPNASIRQLVQGLSVVFGDGRAMRELQALLDDATASLEARRRAMRILVQSRTDGLFPTLRQLLRQRDLAGDAVAALGEYGHPRTPSVLLEAFSGLPDEARRSAIEVLTSRPAFAQALLRAVDGGRIGRDEVPVYQQRRLRALQDQTINAALDRLWPNPTPELANKEGLYAKYRSLLSPQALSDADLKMGKELFAKHCASCHRLFGEGGASGPDLTGSHRSSLDYLLFNLLEPSSDVAEQFRVSILELDDGRLLTGLVTQETDAVLRLQTPTDTLVVEKSRVSSRVRSHQSLMPDGLLTALSDDEAHDLIAYLMFAHP
jgi:putative heme-binding domain-containing protein